MRNTFVLIGLVMFLQTHLAHAAASEAYIIKHTYPSHTCASLRIRSHDIDRSCEFTQDDPFIKAYPYRRYQNFKYYKGNDTLPPTYRMPRNIRRCNNYSFSRANHRLPALNYRCND